MEKAEALAAVTGTSLDKGVELDALTKPIIGPNAPILLQIVSYPIRMADVNVTIQAKPKYLF
jgi:hypothetical protein